MMTWWGGVPGFLSSFFWAVFGPKIYTHDSDWGQVLIFRSVVETSVLWFLFFPGNIPLLLGKFLTSVRTVGSCMASVYSSAPLGTVTSRAQTTPKEKCNNCIVLVSSA